MQDSTYDSLISRLKKQAFVPGDQVGQPPVDPATGLPVDPATGMPIDPSTGMPIDPAMLEQMMGGAGGMPPGMPMDPAAGGMPPGMPMDPAAMGMPPGMPMDPAAMGMPPGMDPAAMGMPPEAPPAEEPPAGSGATASSDDLAVLEERITGLEDIIEDLVGTIEALGGKKLADAKSESAQAQEAVAEAAPEQPQIPGPFGGGAAGALSAINPGASGSVLNNLLGRLGELKAV